MLKLLSTNPVFDDLNKEELNSLSPILKRESFKEGQIIIDANKKPKFLYLIESGSFTLRLLNNEYKTLKPGELIGEIGIINGDFRSGTVIAAELSSVISICGIQLFQDNIIASSTTLKIVKALSKRITNYLRSKEQISTLEIIQQGENHTVEFKSTLRWNLFTKTKDKVIEKAVLKTLVAFMNSKGGMLIIGVADNGEILGLENDQFENNDKLLLHLSGIIKTRIGPLHLKYLHFSIEKIIDKEILRIDCFPAAIPAYYKDDISEHFYIRNGPATIDLRISKLYDYIVDRFKIKNLVST